MAHNTKVNALIYICVSSASATPEMTDTHKNLAHRECKSQDVLLYIPNIVGYVRLALLVLAIGIGREQQYYIAFYLLVINFALDAVDGILARALHQVWCSLMFPSSREIRQAGVQSEF